MDTKEIITVFKDAGWSGVLHRNINNALANLNKNNGYCGVDTGKSSGSFRQRPVSGTRNVMILSVMDANI